MPYVDEPCVLDGFDYLKVERFFDLEREREGGPGQYYSSSSVFDIFKFFVRPFHIFSFRFIATLLH